ncbi:DUF1566 domain-containing protein [bacterium]|nr:DUF1566 domain-containing protein [bacterium]
MIRTGRWFVYSMQAAMLLIAATALGEGVATVTPDSAQAGTSALTVTYTLTETPPPPPIDAPLVGAAIGTISGTNVTRVDTYNVSALFNIPAGETPGTKDATVTFGGPSGNVVFSKANGFTVTGAANSPPTITADPVTRSIVEGATAKFSVAALGDGTLEYQWQKNQTNIPGAIESTYPITDTSAADAATYRCVVSNAFGDATSAEATLTVLSPPTIPYPIVDTNQSTCYNSMTEITPPTVGQPFYGQDAQIDGWPPSYSISDDGLTVFDHVTRLEWVKDADLDGDNDIDVDDKLSWEDAMSYPATLNAMNFAGHNDWRLPSIKELYSLMDFTGYTGTTTETSKPYLDEDFFDFAFGDENAGERMIDSQWATTSIYTGLTMEGNTPQYPGSTTDFGVNFADGRIKGYGLTNPGTGEDKLFYVRCVRGNTDYGTNDFVDNDDGTITDRATALMWPKDDSASGKNWEEALAYVEQLNASNYLGHNDWRLPNVKELHSLLDYSRSPQATNSAAIDPMFNVTPITDEGGGTDYPFYWSGTTHVENETGDHGSYVAFGEALGWMEEPPDSGSYTLMDVHGAGAQRSDPKTGDPADYPYGFGPQGDVIRIYNFVRPVRDAEVPVIVAAQSGWFVY